MHIIGSRVKKKIFLYFIMSMVIVLSAGYANSDEKADEAETDLLASAVTIAKTVRSPSSKYRLLHEIANKYAEIGEKERSLEIKLQALEIEYQSVQTKSFKSGDDKAFELVRIAAEYAEAGQNERTAVILDEAHQIIKGIVDERKRINLIERLVKLTNNYIQPGENEKAALILDQAYQIAEGIVDDCKKVETLVKLSDTYIKLGQKQKAVEILSQMLSAVKLMKYDYTKDPDAMRWGWDTVLPSLPFRKRDKIEAYVKDSIRSSIAINFARVGDYERGLEIERAIKDIFAKAATLEKIALEYIESQQYEQALNTVKSIQNKEHRDSVLSTIAVKFAEARQHDYAIQAAEMIIYKPKKCSILAEVAVKEMEIGEKDKSIETLTRAFDVAQGIKGTDNIAIYAILKLSDASIKLGQKEKAIEILDKSFHGLKNTEISRERAFRLEDIAIKSIEAGQYDLPLEIVQVIESQDVKGLVLSRIAGKYAEAGQKEKAVEMLSQALQETESVKDTNWGSLSLGEIAVDYAKIGEYQKAAQIAESSGHYEALEKIAVRCATDGRLEQAIKIAESITGNQRNAALVKIVHSLVETGQYDQAFQVVKTMEGDRYSELVILVNKYAEAGQYDRAIEAANLIHHAPSEGRVLAKIATRCFELGQFERALEIAGTIRSPNEKAKALAEIAVGLSEAGQYERALEIAETIQHADDVKALTLARMGIIYAKAGHKMSDSESEMLQKIMGAVK